MKPVFLYIFCIMAVSMTACKKTSEPVFQPTQPTPPAATPPENNQNPNDVIETASPVQKAVSISVNSNIGGYQEALPARYNLTTKKYPLLIFLHGVGELGNGTSDLSKAAMNGVPALIRRQNFPPGFTVQGQSYSFIVISPQFKSWPSANDVNDLINYVTTKYRVDNARIYVSGLSMGGGVTWETGVSYGNKIAAIVPICGASSPTTTKAQKIASFNLPVWAFHNEDDITVTIYNTLNYIKFINALNPTIPARQTIWPTGGHNAWTKATDPNYKEDGKNIYEWMLQYTRN